MSKRKDRDKQFEAAKRKRNGLPRTNEWELTRQRKAQQRRSIGNAFDNHLTRLFGLLP